jgi:tetratricopeptide (TPR) repeat protein
MNSKFSYLLFLTLLFGCAKQKKNNSNEVTNHLKEASIEAEAGNYQRALEITNKAYKIDPSPKIGALKATLLYQLQKFEESLTLFKKIIDDPKTPALTKSDVKNNYACTLLCLNRKEEAKQIWRNLAFDKNYLSPEVAWFNLGLLEFSDGISEQKELNENKKTHSKIHFNNSTKFFEKAIEIACNYIDAYFYLAIAQFQLKQFEQAKNNILTILSKVPEHKPAQDILIRINSEISKLKE